MNALEMNRMGNGGVAKGRRESRLQMDVHYEV